MPPMLRSSRPRSACPKRTTSARGTSGAPWPPAATSRERKSLTTRTPTRSEEHTSELQSQSNLVCRLLLEKKKKKKKTSRPQTRPETEYGRDSQHPYDTCS